MQTETTQGQKVARPVVGEKKEIVYYGAHVSGIWGRKRKADVIVFDLAEVAKSENQPSEEILRRFLDALIAREKIRPGANVRVFAHDQTLENESGYVIRRFDLLAQRTLFRTTV